MKRGRGREREREGREGERGDMYPHSTSPV